MKRIYLLFIILLSAIPAHGQSKGVDPHYFETGLWVCNGGGDAASLDDDIANIGNNVTLTRTVIDELASNNKCHRIEADNIKLGRNTVLARLHALACRAQAGEKDGPHPVIHTTGF